jgi:adenosylcobinamide-phosphate synthase
VDLSALAAAYGLDWLIGDPPRPTHPGRTVGRVATWLEARLYPLGEARGHLAGAGAAYALILVGGAYAACWLALAAAGRAGPVVRWLVEVWLLQTALAARSLRDAARSVERPLAAGHLELARGRLPQLVGRDVAGLSEEGVRRAVVESVAESTVDGVVAPLCYAALGGPALAWAYKAVNTLDSLVGHRDRHYSLFGRTAARLDDLANWLPARLAAALALLVSAVLPGLDARAGWAAWRRDARRHPSPNAGVVESAFAGALGLRLGGWSRYDGVPRFAGDLNPQGGPPGAGSVGRALGLAAWTSLLALAACLLVGWRL